METQFQVLLSSMVVYSSLGMQILWIVSGVRSCSAAHVDTDSMLTQELLYRTR
jgi:hypothetical protein